MYGTLGLPSGVEDRHVHAGQRERDRLMLVAHRDDHDAVPAGRGQSDQMVPKDRVAVVGVVVVERDNHRLLRPRWAGRCGSGSAAVCDRLAQALQQTLQVRHALAQRCQVGAKLADIFADRPLPGEDQAGQSDADGR